MSPSVFEVDPTLFVTVVPCGPLPPDQLVAGLPDATYFEAFPLQGNEQLHREACTVVMRALGKSHPLVALVDGDSCKIMIGAQQPTGQVLFSYHWVRVRKAKMPRPPVLGEAFCPGGVC